VDPSLPVYMYVQVADRVAARIATGGLRPGSRLPNERELAAEYRVGLNTARRAVQELRARGLVVTLPSKGTYITTQPEPEGRQG
jgi:GntR family transcriptional regulator